MNEIPKSIKMLQKFLNQFSKLNKGHVREWAEIRFAAAKIMMLTDPNHIFSLYTDKDAADIIGLDLASEDPVL